MKCVLFLLCLLICVSLNRSKDFTVGTRINNLLISTEKVEYRNIPFIKRDVDYVYVDKKLRIIKGIIARDLSRTEAEVTLIEGGIGATNVTLHFKSERGGRINYLVLIFSYNSETRGSEMRSHLLN